MRLRPSLLSLLLLPLLLPALPAHAQREGERPPTQDPFTHPPAPEVPGGRYKSHSYQDGVLTVYATDGSARQVQDWAAGVVKISYFAPGRQPVADTSVSVVQKPTYESVNRKLEQPLALAAAVGAKPLAGLTDSPAKLVLVIPSRLNSSGNYDAQALVIDKQTLRISLEAQKGTLFAEAGPAFHRQPRTAPADDLPPSRADEASGTGVRVALQPGERLYGTGSRALPLDRRGYRLELYNQAHYGYGSGEQNLNVTLPVVLSSRGYLLLFDHYAAGYLDLGKQRPDALEYGVQGLNSLSYFVVTGANQGEIMNRYTALTGRQPLPPRWALGLIQSRFGYRSQAEMLDVARRMRQADFPLDALVLDLYWFGGTTRQGDFAWDQTKFPDPAGMMRDLNAQGVKTILISEPYVMRTSLNDSLVRTRQLVGTTAAGRPFTVGSFWAGPASILDVFKPSTRSWMWQQYRRLHDQGAGGWWSDLGEPENHPLAMQHLPGSTAQVHNAYGLTWARIFQDNYAKEYPDERLFNLARSGWAGMQRNSVFPWSGDVSRTWSGLQAQVPIMVGMGQAGVGYMHSDAGGFGANATRDPELYTRWLQLAALCPVLRPHSDQVVPPEPYTYPEPYRSIVRHYTHLRAELLPYLYTLAAENTRTGAPLVRAMDYYDLQPGLQPEDHSTPGVWTAPEKRPPAAPTDLASLNSQYLLGPNLLVAPVSEPGQRRRNVWLPATPGGWVDFESGETLPGGQLVGLPAPLGHVPLLARAGAFVPMTAYRPGTAAFRADTLEMRYFANLEPGATSRFTSYEDDGHSAQALGKNQFAITEWTGTRSETSSALQFLALGVKLTGTYPGAPGRRLVKLHVVGLADAPEAISVGGELIPATAWHFDATHHELQLAFPLQREVSILIGQSGKPFPTAVATRADLTPDPVILGRPESREFSDAATLRYTRYTAAPAALRIRDALGQVLRELPTDPAAGPHTLRWDGRDAQGRLVPPGVYVAELQGQHQQLVRL